MAFNKNDKADGAKGKKRRRSSQKKKSLCILWQRRTVRSITRDTNKLKRYVSERGKILPRRITGNCAKHQRALTVAVKRARHLALMPYTMG